jgi:hypothetical protein
MQATSTPTLAQNKSSGFAALGGAAVLAAAVGVGALIGANLSTLAAPAAGNDANVAAYALGVQRSGEIGAMTQAQRGLLLQRQGEIALGAKNLAAPVEIMPKREIENGAVIARRPFDAPIGWSGSLGYGTTAVDPANVSPAGAQAAANGWLATQLHGDDLYPAVPFVYDRTVNSYPKPVYPPAAPAEGNHDSVGISHR